MGGGVCAPGTAGHLPCGTARGACNPGVQARVCSSACAWGALGVCGGAYVGPTVERCGNSDDEDCNGLVDEGCGCEPVGEDAGTSFVVNQYSAPSGGVKMIADPTRCFVYVDAGVGSGLLVFDTATKALVRTLALGWTIHDLDMDPQSRLLHIAIETGIQRLDPDNGFTAVSSRFADQPVRIDGDADTGYILTRGNLSGSQDLLGLQHAGSSSALLDRISVLGQADIELSPSGRSLFLGAKFWSSFGPFPTVVRYDLDGASATLSASRPYLPAAPVEATPSWPLYLSPSGRHLYYAGHQLDAATHSFVRGITNEHIFAEDATGKLAVGEFHVFDAELVQPIGTLRARAAAAALAVRDQEIWYLNAANGRMYVENVRDYTDGASLGVRELPPEDIAAYELTRLVADPMRARLYGLDKNRGLVVVVDRATLTATRAIIVGPKPESLDIDLDGGSLYVLHESVAALARIDLGTFTFDRFIPLPSPGHMAEALADHFVLAQGWESGTVLLIDTIADSVTDVAIPGGLCSAAADGRTVFIAERNQVPTRYTFFGGALTETSRSTFPTYVDYGAAAVPDGSGVFFDRYRFGGPDLVRELTLPEAILHVSPDGALALSERKVYDAASGALKGELPELATVAAVGPDGKLYAWDGAAIRAVDLAPFR